MKVRCINNGDGVLSITVGKTYEVKRSIDEFFEIINDNGELWTYMKLRFEEVKEMEVENVLELEYQEVFNKVAVRIKHQNEDILKRSKFKDEEIGVRSASYPDFNSKDLYIRGCDYDEDSHFDIVSKEKAEQIKEKVRKINEKYGIRKRWRAKNGDKYFCITRDLGDFIVDKWTDDRCISDNKNYESNNYFETREGAERVLEKIKQVFKEV